MEPAGDACKHDGQAVDEGQEMTAKPRPFSELADVTALLASLMFGTMKGDAAPLRSDNLPRSHAGKPNRRLADVPVLEHRRLRQRLALRPPGDARGRRRR